MSCSSQTSDEQVRAGVCHVAAKPQMNRLEGVYVMQLPDLR